MNNSKHLNQKMFKARFNHINKKQIPVWVSVFLLVEVKTEACLLIIEQSTGLFSQSASPFGLASWKLVRRFKSLNNK